jgi:hypothetical protein
MTGSYATPGRCALRALLLVPVIAGVACGHGKKSDSGSAPAASNAPAAAPKAAQLATVEGVVRMAEGAKLPSYPSDTMERTVLAHVHNAPLPESCSPPKTTDRQPVQLTADGLLSGVMVVATGFSHQPERPPMVHEVSIEDCRLTPSLVVAMKGDTLRVRNTVNYPFMPTYRERGMARTLTPGQTYDVALDKPGVQPLLCGFTAPCGRTDVIVLLHPLYAKTDALGKFKIEGLPPDEDLSINVWHPLFQDSRQKVRLGSGEHKSLEFVLSPTAVPSATTAEAPQAPAPDKPAAPPKKTH